MNRKLQFFFSSIWLIFSLLLDAETGTYDKGDA